MVRLACAVNLIAFARGDLRECNQPRACACFLRQRSNWCEAHETTAHLSRPDQVQLLSSLGFRDCVDSLQDFLCLAFFSPCVDAMINASSAPTLQTALIHAGFVSLPVYPCKNVCEIAREKCKTVISPDQFPAW